MSDLPLAVTEAFLIRTAAMMDGPTARFVLQMAFENRAEWLTENEELTNMLFAWARGDKPGWTPKPREGKLL